MVLAGKEYGSGSSRDWAAKGTLLLGVRAVIAESYERIHRSNLVGMGVLPLQFVGRRDGRVARPRRGASVHDPRHRGGVAAARSWSRSRRRRTTAPRRSFEVLARVDSPADVEYLRHGGILQMVLRRMMAG